MPDAAAITPPVELVFKSVLVSAERARLVVVALVATLLVAKKVDDVAFVVLRFVAKKLVEVALVVVPKFTVKRSMVDEALMLIPSVVVGVSAPEMMFQSLNALER